MNKCVFRFLTVSMLCGFIFFSGCPVQNGKFFPSSLKDVSSDSDENILYFLNNPAFIPTEYSVLSNKKSEVISGSYSLKGESSPNTLHAVFLFTDRMKLPLCPKKTYTVSFDYRILTKGRHDFEVLFYSPSEAEQYTEPQKLCINSEKGLDGSAHFTCTLKDYDDYMIYWVLVDGGAVSIDNIHIFEEDTQTVYYVLDIEAEKAVVNVNRNTITQKIANKTCVPAFFPWITYKKSGYYDTEKNPYALVWTRNGLARDIESARAEISDLESYRMQKDMNTLYLITPDWHIWTPIREELSRRSQFYLNETFKTNRDCEYPVSFMINFEHRDWSFLLAEKALNYKKAGFDGIMLDHWNNDAGNGRNKKKVEAARLDIIKKIRKKAGYDFILMGNVNWNMHDLTEHYLSGVYAELYKPYPSRTYALSYADERPEEGLFSIERLEAFLIHWNSVLQWPKIIAVEAWKRTDDDDKLIEDFADHKNYKTAKLLAAMTCVIPENGYFLYTDNNSDKKDSDHEPVYYNFYNTDFGKSISTMRRVGEGAAYKEYERGYIAYNRTTEPIVFYTPNGTKISLNALEGIFAAK